MVNYLPGHIEIYDCNREKSVKSKRVINIERYVVYKITNIINGKIYIGVTNNIKRRWRLDGIEYRPPIKNDHHRSFWNAIQKYGWNNFQKEILFENLTKEEAYIKEIEMIKECDSTNKKIGYNIAPGGNGGIIYKVHPRGMLGKHHSKENKEKHRVFMSDRKNNPMYNGQTIWGVTHPHPKGMKGKHHTEEKKRQISETLKQKGHAKKKVEATFPNGEIKIFSSLNECAAFFETSPTSSFIRKLIQSNKPYVLHPNTKTNREKFKKLEGLTLKYLDNTEVTDKTKKMLVP